MSVRLNHPMPALRRGDLKYAALTGVASGIAVAVSSTRSRVKNGLEAGITVSITLVCAILLSRKLATRRANILGAGIIAILGLPTAIYSESAVCILMLTTMSTFLSILGPDGESRRRLPLPL